ncbi:7 transmembrane sweet-taste receptor of 3 GCPR [Nitzschia inconspicua]|uniref:7 transmembrane sweet-taste receptor of 3 GCPR n=1 Tax=Nitzschia inconspicua TaxID=303405 RepID=A0A9K3L2M6_9STRA|nr:7 transmembrane sweet-taste receptor of 3 GCPR [Nitzschia inconspicua]
MEVPDSADIVRLTAGVKGTALALCGVAMITTIGLGIWTFRNQTSRLVRASQPVFLYIVLLGVFVSNTFEYHSVGLSTSCVGRMQRPRLAREAVGTGIVFGALHAKLYRINKIAQSAQKFQRITVTACEALKPTIAITVVISVISFGQCEQLDFLLALGALLILLFVMLCWQAFQARNISTEFAESKSIFAILLLMNIAVFMGWPIIVLSQDSPNVLVLIVTLISFTLAMATCCFLFVPKILSVWKNGKSGPPVSPVTITGMSEETSSDPMGRNNEGAAGNLWFSTSDSNQKGPK